MSGLPGTFQVLPRQGSRVKNCPQRNLQGILKKRLGLITCSAYRGRLVGKKIFSIVLFVFRCGPYILIICGEGKIFLLVPEKTVGIIHRVRGIPPLISISPDTMAGVAPTTPVPRRPFTSCHLSHPGPLFLVPEIKVHYFFGINIFWNSHAAGTALSTKLKGREMVYYYHGQSTSPEVMDHVDQPHSPAAVLA
jgi:hypothetical protein